MYLDKDVSSLSPKERQVFLALGDSRWDYRTVDGIREQTGLSTSEIEKFLRHYQDKFVYKAPVPDRLGRQLYTLMRGRPEVRDLLNRLRMFIGKTFD